MKRLIYILRDNNIECLPNERFTLDVEMFPEYSEEPVFPKQVLFESPKLKAGKKSVPEGVHSMFRYFLDGSQRSHRVIDASFGSHYLPICAGQIGVAVLERLDSGRMVPRKDLTRVENILAVPNVIGQDNAKDLEQKINKEMSKNDHFRIVRYDYQTKDDKDPADLGRAMIIHEMQMLELRTIRDMITNQAIQEDKMLAKDGGLQYRDTKIKDLNLSKDDLVQLRNVIGLAKTFKPNMTVGQGRGRQDLGNLTKGLDWKERTTVISPNKDEITAHGWWYLRLRPREKVYSPLQGIAKIEVFASDEEKENDGIAEARADTISSYVLRERNVTAYNADKRWASHIYPIFLAETYLRSSFLSHERFKAMII
ncbi:MAG TPA: hypothetical protein ENO22_05895 [candidate division Zixibacteria bacterium]|nr:hypothetical protein [candidate division Zixibacteria bacterium]